MDILVNSAWAGAEHVMQPYFWDTPFWRQPVALFDDFYTVGLRSCLTAARQAAGIMVEQGNGLIVNISFYSARRYWVGVSHGVFKAATDKLTADIAHELHPYGVAAVSLYPGNVRTEGMLAAAGEAGMADSESPLFVGRCVAALAGDPAVLRRSGGVARTGDLAVEYGLRDVDGRIPPLPDFRVNGD